MRYAKKAILSTFVILLALILGTTYWVLVVSPYELPQGALVFDRLKPPSSGTLLDGAGIGISYFQRNDPIAFYKPLDQIDKKLRDYVIMLEDGKFFMHNGFDVEEINNSFWKNFKAGKVKRGGSGITQQLAKNLFLDRQRSYTRKLYEVPWTIKIESSLTKRQILELYLNSIEWGPGLAGAEAASRYFFGKSCSNLDPGEAMYLALIIPNPTRFNVIKNPGAIRSLETKRKWFVNRLVGEKKISHSEKQAYLEMSFGVLPLDASERQYPAPVPSAFKIPEWMNHFKPRIKNKTSQVTIIKSIQLRGAEPSAWTQAEPNSTATENEENDGTSPAILSRVGSNTWCAKAANGTTSGYWKLDEELIPTSAFAQELANLGHSLSGCEETDASRSANQ